MRIIFFGTPQFAVPSLKRLLDAPEFEVLAVVTQPDKRRGRGTELTPSPIKTLALEHHLPIWQPRSVKKDAETLEYLRKADADAFVVVAYGQILSQEILDMPRFGCVNAHGSILPKYRGAAPIQWCLYHGEPETGITTMLMDAGMDTGPMLLKATTPIKPLDTAHDLAQTLSLQAADLLVETLLGLAQQTIQPIPQNNDEATYAPLIQKQDYMLDWSKPAIALHNQIRGFYPNCVTTFRGNSLKVFRTVSLEWADSLSPELQKLASEFATLNETLAPPGTVVGILKNHGPVVKTGEGLLLLQEIQLAGKRSQQGWDFVNGTRLTVGEEMG
ncbi:MAG TPA: methionyl-tRNA formyltransferase [Crinalium sp.]|jgi:methionyl-tRNA formyltransferase